MKKLLVFCNGLYGGGAETVLQTLLSHLDRTRYDITLYSLKEEVLTPLYPEGIRYRHVFKQYRPTDSALRRFRVKCVNKVKLLCYDHLSAGWFYRLFVRGKYDVEVAFIEGYATRIVSGSPHCESKKIAWVHIDLKENHWTTVAYRNPKEEGLAYKHFDQVICVSQYVKRQLLELYPFLEHVGVRYNPIDTEQIRLKAEEKGLVLPRTGEGVRLISVGRLVPQKGFDRLLTVVKKLRIHGVNVSLAIIGEGRERTRLEADIEQNDLSECVTLCGYKANPYPYIKSADWFVCSSRSEGYSTAVTEALVLGVPVVTTDCSGMSELLENGKYGLITPNTEAALYEGLKSVLATKEMWQHYKRNIVQRGTATLEEQMHGIESLF